MLSDPHCPGISLPSLSDEAVVEVLDFLLDLLRLLESHYSGRIHRYHEDRSYHHRLQADSASPDGRALFLIRLQLQTPSSSKLTAFLFNRPPLLSITKRDHPNINHLTIRNIVRGVRHARCYRYPRS